MPFTKEIADDALWLPDSRLEAVDTLERAIRHRQCALMVGDPGSGKSCVLRAVRHRLSEADVRMTYFHNTTLSVRDFYRQLCVALDLEAAATAAKLFHAVATHIEELTREAVHPVLLLDEAQLLRSETLQQLHVLLNYGWDSDPLLSLVMVGLPRLEDRLARRKNRSLYSRIHHRIRLEPMGPDDTADYLKFRLAEVGIDGEVFSRQAAGLIHEASRGMLRDVDRLAGQAMWTALKADTRIVEREIVTDTLDVQPLNSLGDQP
jgi:type II secretory pathway predicted ATPase ExeA